jgi:hypothetical protein
MVHGIACWMKGKASNLSLVVSSFMGVCPGLSTWAPLLANLKASRSKPRRQACSTPPGRHLGFKRAARLGALGRLTVFRDGLQIFLARLGIVESAMGAASGSPNLRCASECANGSQHLASPRRRSSRLAEDSGAFQKPRTSLRRFRREAEPSSPLQSLAARRGIFGRLSESGSAFPKAFNGAQNSGTRLRSLKRLSESCDGAPKIPRFRRIFQRAPESSRSFPIPWAHV